MLTTPYKFHHIGPLGFPEASLKTCCQQTVQLRLPATWATGGWQHANNAMDGIPHSQSIQEPSGTEFSNSTNKQKEEEEGMCQLLHD